MKSNDECSRQPLVVLVLATSWLNGCATEGFDRRGGGVCPPVLEYSREVQAQATEELTSLPEGSAMVEMIRDYAVMRDQTRSCNR